MDFPNTPPGVFGNVQLKLLMINFDDPGIAVALLAIIIGLRLALYVAERLLAGRAAVATVSLLSPDDTAEADQLAMEEPGAPLPRESATESHPIRFFTEVLDSALIAVILVFFLIRPFVLQAFFIPSESMVPTLQMGDKLLATKYSYHLREPRRGEIVVFHAPEVALKTLGLPYDAKHPTDYVKRVIGVPNDRVRIMDGVGVFINGERLQEPYTAAQPDYFFPKNPSGNDAFLYQQARKQMSSLVKGDELVVPKGYLFVLGDNRTQSHDSHAWGLLPRKSLVAKAAFIFWPPPRIGVIR